MAKVFNSSVYAMYLPSTEATIFSLRKTSASARAEDSATVSTVW